MAKEGLQDTVSARVEELVKEHVGMNVQLSPETLLQDDLEIDSLELVDLGIKLEKAFGIQLADAAVRRSIKLDDLTQLVLQALHEEAKKA